MPEVTSFNMHIINDIDSQRWTETQLCATIRTAEGEEGNEFSTIVGLEMWWKRYQFSYLGGMCAASLSIAC
jgi:hypothetical protein